MLSPTVGEATPPEPSELMKVSFGSGVAECVGEG